jgi:hypothetical protein
MAKVRNVAPRLGCGASDKCPIAPELINPANEAVRKAYIGQPGNWRSRPMLTFILGHRGSNTGQGRGWSAAPVRLRHWEHGAGAAAHKSALPALTPFLTGADVMTGPLKGVVRTEKIRDYTIEFYDDSTVFCACSSWRMSELPVDLRVCEHIQEIRDRG